MSREALRQQLLLRALWRRGGAAGALAGWTRGDSAPGLAAYRGNGGAVAARALEAAFPTVAQLVGADSFDALASALWHRHPPTRGDLGEWGDALPDFIAASAQLADEPYLADSARLDACVHRATRAADAPAAALALDRLASVDPSRLRIHLAPGAATVSSAWPIVAIWHAHHRAPADGADAFAPVREAFAAARADTAFVWRDASFRVQVEGLEPADIAFTDALRAGHPLGAALELSGPGFPFDRWLAHALQCGWIVAIDPIDFEEIPS